MTRSLRVLSAAEAEGLKSAQYMKIQSNSHYQQTYLNALTVTVEVQAEIGATTINVRSVSAMELKAGDQFEIDDGLGTLFTLTADASVLADTPIDLTFTPALDEVAAAAAVLDLLFTTRRGEVAERTVVMTYESNRE